MKKPSNNFLALLMIGLMIFSLIGTTLISFKAEEKASLSGKVPLEQTGIVGVEVVVPSEGTTGGGVSGGGGGGGKGPVTHILDFRIKDRYNIIVGFGDTIVIILTDVDRYEMKVEKLIAGKTIGLSLEGIDFNIYPDEITSIDFNRDLKPDLKVEMDNTNLVFTLIQIPKKPSKLPPIISSQKKIFEEGEDLEGIQLSKPFPLAIWILIFLIILILILIIKQQFRLRHLEKYQVEKLNKLAGEYANKKLSDRHRRIIYNKLQRQIKILDKSYKSKVISMQSYVLSRQKLKDLQRKL